MCYNPLQNINIIYFEVVRGDRFRKCYERYANYIFLNGATQKYIILMFCKYINRVCAKLFNPVPNSLRRDLCENIMDKK